MTAPAARVRMSPEEYFDWEETQPEKHEYYYGEVFAMSGGTDRHALLTMNVGGALRAALRGEGCRVYSSDLRIQITESDHYVYPDVSVVCGEPAFAYANRTTLLNPTLVVEVLSPSTAGYDRGMKADAYRRLPSLVEVVLVEQDRRAVEVHHRTDGGVWTIHTSGAEGEVVELAAFGAQLALDEVYEGVELPDVPWMPGRVE